MGWVRMDDQRAMNRKLREAGFEARGLDEAAIEQISADMTDGYISEATVEMLAVGHACRHWRKVVDRLVKVGRWKPVKGGWLVHDYLEFNPSRTDWEAERERKRVAGRRGGEASAQARAAAGGSPPGKPPGQANAVANAVANGQPNRKPPGQANAVANAVANGQPEPEPKKAAAAACRSLTPGDAPSPAAAAAASTSDHPKAQARPTKLLVDAALRIIAERHLAATSQPVKNPNGWLASAVKGLRTDLSDRLAAAAEIASFDTPEVLADWLEPAHKNGSNGNGIRREYAAERTDCERCGGSGWIDVDPDREAFSAMAVDACPDCVTVTA